MTLTERTSILPLYFLPVPYLVPPVLSLYIRHLGHRGRVHQGPPAALPRCTPYGRRGHFSDYDILHFPSRHNKLFCIRYLLYLLIVLLLFR